jgi:hypothetical protein
LLVYDTDKSEFYHFNATAWSPLLNGDYWSRPSTNRRRISNLLDSVGVGLTSPTEWLDVDGNVRSRNNLMADNDIIADGTISGATLVASDNLVTGGTGFVNGNLSTNGILTTTSDLVVNNTGATIQLKTSGTNKGYFQLAGDNVRMGTNSGNNAGNLIIRMDGTDRVFVDEAGAVGIGVSSPTEKLDVAGNINFSGKVTSSQTGNQSLTPVCWGLNNANGGLIRGTANVSVARLGEGEYRITCSSITATSVPFITGHYVGIFYSWVYSVAGQLDIHVYRQVDVGSYTHIDQQFSFMIY